MSVLYHTHASTQASFILPSKLGIDEKTNTIILPILPNIYTFAGNNFISYKNTYAILRGGSDGAEAIETTVKKLHKRNSIATGFDYDFFHLYLRLGKGEKGNKKETISLDFYTRVRTRGHLFFSKEFGEVLWYGNRPYAGKTIDMNPLGIFFQSWLEYGAGTAFNVIDNENLKLRIGVKARYLQGIACIKNDIEKIDFTTEQDGKYMEISTKYNIYTSNIDSTFRLKPQGHGWAGDVGATALLGEKFEVSLGITDLGYIKYKSNVKVVSLDTTIRYEGVAFKDSDDDIHIDTIEGVFKPRTITNGGHFSSSLGAKITLQGAYKTGFKTTKKGYEYAAHTIYFTYVQGLQNNAGTITHPYFSGAYNFTVGHLCAGGFLNYGGFYKSSFGIFTSVQFGFFRWGITASNFAPMILRNTPLGAEVSTNMSFAF